MKKLSVFLCAMVLVFGVMRTANAAIYHFTGDSMVYGVSFEAYLNGTKTNFSAPSIIDHNLLGFSWLRMDVNSVEYNTTLLGVYTELSVQKTHNGMVTWPYVVGNLEIPFSVHFTDLTFQSSISRGPYDINPSTLDFSSPDDTLTNQNDGLLSISGYFEVANRQFGFDFNQPADRFYRYLYKGHFDDTGYPNSLELIHDHFETFSYSIDFDELLLQTIIDENLSNLFFGNNANYQYFVEQYGYPGDSKLEIYLNDVKISTGVYGSVWQGTRIPIPSAVWLLGFGMIGLVTFRRKLIKEDAQ